MRTITGFRKSLDPLLCAGLTYSRRFFPSTEPEAEEEWEEVEGGESAENGPTIKEGEEGERGEKGAEEDTSKITLPDVPTAEPIDGGPSPKKQKQKQDDEEKL